MKIPFFASTRVFFILALGTLLPWQAASVAEDSGDTSVHVVSYGFLDAEQATDLAKGFLSPSGKVTANTRNNTLIVIDRPEIAQRIQQYFRSMPAPQNIFIEVQVQEAEQTSTSVAGLPLEASMSHQNRAMQLSVMEGSHATLMVGEKVPFPTFFFQFFLTHGYIVEGTEFEDVGSRLDVCPKIIDGVAQITLTPVISYLSDRTRRTIAIREMSTQIIADNGQTVEIGALPEAGDFNKQFFRNQYNRSVRFSLTPRW